MSDKLGQLRCDIRRIERFVDADAYFEDDAAQDRFNDAIAVALETVDAVEASQTVGTTGGEMTVTILTPGPAGEYERITMALDAIERGPVIDGGAKALRAIAKRAANLAHIMSTRESWVCFHRASVANNDGDMVCIHCGEVVRRRTDAVRPPD